MNQKTVRDWKGVPQPAPEIRGRLCDERADLDIRLIQQGRDSFAVLYGLQVKPDLSYGQAGLEYGICVMHALACRDKVDSRPKGER